MWYNMDIHVVSTKLCSCSCMHSNPSSLWLIEESDTGDYDEYQEQLAELNAEKFPEEEEEEPEEEEEEVHERFQSAIAEKFEEQNEAIFALKVQISRHTLWSTMSRKLVHCA